MEAYEPTWGSVTKINKNKNDTHTPPLFMHTFPAQNSERDIFSLHADLTRISRGSHADIFTRISRGSHADLTRISRGSHADIFTRTFPRISRGHFYADIFTRTFLRSTRVPRFARALFTTVVTTRVHFFTL